MSIFDNLPPTISFSEKVEVKEFSDQKNVVICYSKDFSNEDLDKLRENGKILRWSPAHANLDFANLDFDYLLVDLREKEARLQLAKQDLDNFHVVLFSWWFQKDDSFVSKLKGNYITSLPKRWISRQDFLDQLISSKLESPSIVKSFLRLILACWK